MTCFWRQACRSALVVPTWWRHGRYHIVVRIVLNAVQISGCGDGLVSSYAENWPAACSSETRLRLRARRSSFAPHVVGGKKRSPAPRTGAPRSPKRTWAENDGAQPLQRFALCENTAAVDATEGRLAFSSIPEALSKPFRTERRLQTGKTGVAAFFATWPGEETDDDLLTALRELRH